MSDEPPGRDEDEARQHRVFVNLAAAIALILLAAGAFWLLKAMNDRRALENCLNAGRRNCGELIAPVVSP